MNQYLIKSRDKSKLINSIRKNGLIKDISTFVRNVKTRASINEMNLWIHQSIL